MIQISMSHILWPAAISSGIGDMCLPATLGNLIASSNLFFESMSFPALSTVEDFALSKQVDRRISYRLHRAD